MNTTETPRVWIACLASYNAGRLIGEWVDATDMEYMTEAVERIKVAAVKAARADGESPLYFGVPEEFAIHDYDGFPSTLVSQLGEYPNWEHIVTVAAALEEHGDMFRAWCEFRDEIDFDEDLIERCREQCCGQADDEEEYAYEDAKECGLGGIPAVIWGDSMTRPFGADRDSGTNVFEELSSYIDWEAAATALFDHGTLSLVKVNGTGYVFDSER